MIEFIIKIKLLNIASCGSENSKESNDLFLDDFIQKVESLGLQFGGGSDFKSGIHEGVISFPNNEKSILETEIYSLQNWILTHPTKALLLTWQEYDYNDNEQTL
jgi:uncharacterized protein YggL (DUF469 family)